MSAAKPSLFQRLFRSPKPDPANKQGRGFDVGWLIDTQEAGVIWEAPQPFKPGHPKPGTSKSASLCPAVIEFDRRHYIIPVPFDLHFRISTNNQGQMQITNVQGSQGGVRPGMMDRLFAVMPQQEWRYPDKPVVQVTTPYLFLSDDPVYLNQFPAYLHFRQTRLPGVQLCGRFPIDVWPRLLMWAFEWHDLGSDLILRRGEPWFYVRFETPDPAAPVRLHEARMTETLRDYLNQISEVSSYVNQTFSLFKTARQRRPDTLLVRKTD